MPLAPNTDPLAVTLPAAPRHFAMLDDESVAVIEGAKDVCDALEQEPGNTHWMFSEAGLRAFIARAQAALNGSAA